MHKIQQAEMYAKLNYKSKTLAVILALLFGPFGVMYVNVLGGLFLLTVYMITAIAVPELGIAAGIVTVLCGVAIAIEGVGKHNRKELAKANLLMGSD